MSSSSEVSLAILKETTEYNKVEASGSFDTVDFTAESLSGEFQTNSSGKVGGGRRATGQYVVAQTVGGAIQSELTPNAVQRELTLAALMSADWAAPLVSSADTLTIDTAAGTITAAVEDFSALGIAPNEPVVLSGFSGANNNVAVFVTGVSGSVLTAILGEDMTDETSGAGGIVTRPAYAEIGTVRRSYSICKEFTDLTGKGINYTGQRVDTLRVSAKYGEAAGVEFGMAGAGHKVATQASELITNTRTVNPLGSEQELTPGANMNFLAVDGVAVPYCVESVEFTLSNAHRAKQCVASISPRGQTPNTPEISVTMSADLEDANFDLHDLRASQAPMSIGYAMHNADGGFAYYMPEVQLVFPDAQSGGKDNEVMVSLAGKARHSASYGNSLRVWQW